jgi:hypothetical protein
VQVGEATLNLLRDGIPTVKVRFALLTEEGAAGFMDISDITQWSSKTIDAMRAFTEALEEDALRVIFRLPAQGAETSQTDDATGPAQF